MQHHQPYLTARQLGIEEWVRDALITLMPIVAEEGPDRFDMRFWTPDASDCGTACCIGGHIALRGRPLSARDYETLYPLFYPPHAIDWSLITGRQGAAAILNLLTSGKPHWHRAISAE